MIAKESIQNIIFDLGGVLLNIDYNKTINAFQNLGVDNFEELYSQAQQTALFDLFETGKITPADFYAGIRDLAGLDLADQQIEDAWNAMLLNFPKERMVFLEEMSTSYRIFLLSNTNLTHLLAFSKIIQKDLGLSKLDILFEKAYYSHEIGLRKPHKEIFSFVCEAHGLQPNETLFIDDSTQHLVGASAAGLHAIHLDVTKETVIESLGFLR